MLASVVVLAVVDVFVDGGVVQGLYGECHKSGSSISIEVLVYVEPPTLL